MEELSTQKLWLSLSSLLSHPQYLQSGIGSKSANY